MQAGVLGHLKMTNPSAILTTMLQLLVATSLLMFTASHFSSYFSVHHHNALLFCCPLSHNQEPSVVPNIA